MSNQLTTFSFDSHEIRVQHDEKGAVWFVAKDVADALDISWRGVETLASIKPEWQGVRSFRTPGGEQELIVILEQAVYKLAFRSRKPEAERFSDWAADVITSIRKTGSYTANPSRKSAPPDEIIMRNKRAKTVLETYLHAAKLLGTDKPMARAVAVEAVSRQTGVDFQPLLVGNVVSVAPVKPTKLGELRGWSARETNQRLLEAGLQSKDKDDNWAPTERGRPYCTFNPYQSKNSEHSGYQLLWYPTVLELLDTDASEKKEAA